MEQITPRVLKAWLDDADRPKPMLLDVRESREYEICHIDGSQLMTMSTIPARANELERDRDIVVICHHGGRSFQVAMFLEQQGFTRLHNLNGGVDAWAQQVDSTMARY
ncbi:MAG TPA: rhodanese-like domain-containing protein [Rhodocyclaceae bacterium]|jgi:rhodanese-related sulfurtransferase|nr:rhodanese-like domain-containing protein [Rhodocyclaceae bacterium]